MFFPPRKGADTLPDATAAAVAVGAAAAMTKSGMPVWLPYMPEFKHVDEFKMRLLVWVWLRV